MVLVWRELMRQVPLLPGDVLQCLRRHWKILF